MRAPFVLLAALVVLSAFGMGVSVAEPEQVAGRPQLGVFSPNDVLTPGVDTTLDVFLANDARLDQPGPSDFEARVTTARAVTFAVESGDAPVTVRTGTIPVGVVPEGTSGPFPVSLAVQETAEPGTYTLPVTIRYRYTQLVNYDSADETEPPEYVDFGTTRRTSLTIRVESQPRFRLVETGSALSVGDRGTVSLTLENVGTERAGAAAVSVASPDSELLFGNVTDASAAFVGEWDAGERKTVTYSARVVGADVAREYPLRVVVEYDDRDGVTRRSRVLAASVRTRPRPTFQIENADDTLRVGAKGTVSGRLVNTADRPISNAVVRFAPTDETLTPSTTTYPLGTLAPDESAPFSFDVTVARDAPPGPRALRFVVEYDRESGATSTSDELTLVRDVAPHRDTFGVTAPNATFDVDSDGRLTLVVTNNLDESVRDVDVTLVVRDPLSSDAPSAYIPHLAPNESARVSVALSVSNDAITSQYPVSVNLTYTNARGETVVGEPSTVGVAVIEPEQSVPVPLVLGVALVVVVALGWWWRRR